MVQILGLPVVRRVVKVDDIESDTNRITVPRKLEKGDREMIECLLLA